MFNKLLLALAVVLSLDGMAIAQGNPQCPTRPAGDSSNACASTAFVANSLVGLTVPWANITGTPTTLGGYGITDARVALLAAQNYYINGNSGSTAVCGPTGALTCSAGSDSNDCLTPSTACLTTQKVINLLINKRDLAGQSALINLAHGSSNNYAFNCQAGPVLGFSSITVRGDNTARTAVTIVAPASGYAIGPVKDLCTVIVQDVAFADAATNNAAGYILAGVGNYGHVDLAGVTFGPMTVGAFVTSFYGGSVTFFGGNNAITGGANAAFSINAGGMVDFSNITNAFAVSNNLTWGSAFGQLFNNGQVNGLVQLGATGTFGNPTGHVGPRCFVASSWFNVGGNPTNPNAYFPGGTDCVIQSGPAGAILLQTGTGATSTLATGTTGQAIISGGGTSALNTWGSMRQLMSTSFVGALAAATTYFCGTQGCTAASQNAGSLTTPFAGTVKNLYFNTTTAPGVGQTITVTVLTGAFGAAGASSITCTVSGGAATSCNDTTHTATITAGQVWVVQVVMSAGAASSTGTSIAVEFDNP